MPQEIARVAICVEDSIWQFETSVCGRLCKLLKQKAKSFIAKFKKDWFSIKGKRRESELEYYRRVERIID